MPLLRPAPADWQCRTPWAEVTKRLALSRLGSVSSVGGQGPGWLGGLGKLLEARLEITRLLLHLGQQRPSHPSQREPEGLPSSGGSHS